MKNAIAPFGKNFVLGGVEDMRVILTGQNYSLPRWRHMTMRIPVT